MNECTEASVRNECIEASVRKSAHYAGSQPTDAVTMSLIRVIVNVSLLRERANVRLTRVMVNGGHALTRRAECMSELCSAHRTTQDEPRGDCSAPLGQSLHPERAVVQCCCFVSIRVTRGAASRVARTADVRSGQHIRAEEGTHGHEMA